MFSLVHLGCSKKLQNWLRHTPKANAGLAYVAGPHTSKFAPIAGPAIKVAVQAMSAAAIDLLQK